MTSNQDQPQQLINGELKPLSSMESTSNILTIKSKTEYLKAVMYEGVRLRPNHHFHAYHSILSRSISPTPPKSSLFLFRINHPLTPPPITILEGTATWCAQCKAIAPEVAKMVSEYPNVRFYVYDVEECEDVAHELGVRSMPTFSIFKDGDIQVRGNCEEGGRC